MKTLIAIFIFAAAAVAQSPSKVLKQAEKAMGKTPPHSISRTGTVTRASDGATGRYTFYSSQPNQLNETIEVGGFEIESGYNGRSAWMRNSRDGLQTLTGEASAQLQTKASFRSSLWSTAKSDKAKLTAAGTSNVNGKQASVIVLSSPKGASVKMYFDSVTGLLIRDELPGGEVTDYSDYRDVNGVKQPFAEHITANGDAYDIKLETVLPNAAIARSEFDFPRISGEPLPDIPQLLKDLQANSDKSEALIDQFAYTQKRTERELGKDGVLRETGSTTAEMSFYKGRRIYRVIEKDGKPVSASDLAKADKAIAKRIDDIDESIAKQAAKAAKGEPQSDQNQRLSLAELLRASTLLSPRRERFAGRDVIVFDFEPNPAFDLKNAKSQLKVFGKLAGVMWIDAKDRQIVRMEAVLADTVSVAPGALAKLKKGANFTFEQERFNDEIWLPSKSDINLSVQVFWVKGLNFNTVTKTYNYRKFVTEVKGAKVGDDH